MTRVIGAALAALLAAALLIAPVTATASTRTPSPAPTTAAAPQQISDDGVAPIVVLLDTSGSMDGDDGTGLLKLRGAKNAVRDIVRDISPTTVFGLRAYPASGGCDGGSYIQDPQPLSNPESLLSRVEAITAGGDTPTAEALRATADDLKARGYTAATIVLVSDGQSTCDPPCDVAKQLVSEGFDVTVPAIGFRTSDEGTEELECVAKATGSVYLDAGDSAELAEHLDSLVRAQLELKVRYDPAPASGGSTKITAVISHKGGEGAQDVRVALTFKDAGSATSRAGIPPMVRVGNIPPGKTVERTWTVGTGARGDSGTTQFIMSTWASNAVRTQFLGEYETESTKYSKDELGALFDQVSNETPLVIFGDSYSSGEGIGANYQQAPNGVSTKCHRNQETYLGTVFSNAEMRIVACSGAVSSALTGTSDRSNMSQIQEMNSRGVVPGAGAMTFGGNDIGFADVITLCISPQYETVAGGCGYPPYGEAKLEEARSLDYTLAKTYKAAWSALNTSKLREARGGTYVPLLVLPYPKVTHDPRRGSCYQFNPIEVALADALATTLNDTIEAAVNTVRSEGYEVYYVSDVEDAMRPDNTLCSVGPLAYVNGFIPAVGWPPAASESVHPKKQGYAAETDAIVRWAKTEERITPRVSDDAIDKNLEEVADPVAIGWPTPVDITRPADDLVLIRGGAITPLGSGFAPGTAVTTAIHSDPIVLGTLIADENGNIDGTLRIPADIPPGQHTLVISALSADGEFIETRIPVSIVFPTPWWVWGALVVGVVFLLGALTLVLVGLSSRRRAARA